MRTKCIFLAIVTGIIFSHAQEPQWVALPNAPIASSKIDDLFFINPDTGWASVRSGSTARVYKTTNGGANWSSSTVSGTIRSIRFTDALNGWLGSLTYPYLRKSTDGGATWNTVSNFPEGPTGICGMFSTDSLHIFGVGAWNTTRTPYFVKTTNGGESWTMRNMSDVAGALVDIYFFSPDTGYVVGASVDGADLNTKKALVLRTTDGGISWTKVYEGTQAGRLGWKILFPTPTTGYVSLEPFPLSQANIPQYLKTTNRGQNWTVQSFPQGSYTLEMQGLQFLSNGQRGWAGGFRSQAYETTDGGTTWNPSFGANLNRFRMFGDTLGYASGQTIYKFTKEPITSVETYPTTPTVISLDQNYPNPFNPNTTIEFKLNEITHVSLKILDALGREVATLLEQEIDQGVYRKHWDATGFPSGTYFYRLVTPQFTETRKMVLVK